jgi:hypothetical protein
MKRPDLLRLSHVLQALQAQEQGRLLDFLARAHPFRQPWVRPAFTLAGDVALVRGGPRGALATLPFHLDNAVDVPLAWEELLHPWGDHIHADRSLKRGIFTVGVLRPLSDWAGEIIPWLYQNEHVPWGR